MRLARDTAAAALIGFFVAWLTVSTPSKDVAFALLHGVVYAAIMLILILAVESRQRIGTLWRRIAWQSPVRLRNLETVAAGVVGVSPPPVQTPPRKFAEVSVEYLVSLLSGEHLTEAQSAALLSPYIGMWFRHRGTVQEVSVRGAEGAAVHYTSVRFMSDAQTPTVFADFDGEPDLARTVHKGAEIEVIGEIKRASRGIGSGWLTLGHCELVATPR